MGHLTWAIVPIGEGNLQVNGHDEIILECGHVDDATRWIDDREPEEDG